jgi:hypothetical protein
LQLLNLAGSAPAAAKSALLSAATTMAAFVKTMRIAEGSSFQRVANQELGLGQLCLTKP